MILLLIYFILFFIFLKLNSKKEKVDIKKKESFYNLKDRIEGCSDCKCLYYTNNNNLEYTKDDMDKINICDKYDLSKVYDELEESEDNFDLDEYKKCQKQKKLYDKREECIKYDLSEEYKEFNESEFDKKIEDMETELEAEIGKIEFEGFKEKYRIEGQKNIDDLIKKKDILKTNTKEGYDECNEFSEEFDTSKIYGPGEKEFEEALNNSNVVTDDASANYGQPECKLCFPNEPGEPKNAFSYNTICANPRRLRGCNCGVKGLCSPCPEDFDKAHIYALQNMCTNRGYVWKYTSGKKGRTRGYVWDCLHTEQTCKKETLKILKHPDNDKSYSTVDKYFEWDDTAGSCIAASPYLRNICEGENRFWYDARGNIRNDNKCHISPEYCTKYAQDPYKEHDCNVYFGQLVAENLQTTSGVRCARINCGNDGCPLHHPPGFGKDDIDIRDPSLAKLNCDWKVKQANCSHKFLWDKEGPSRYDYVENAANMIPWNLENSVCNGKKQILTKEQRDEKCRVP